MFSVLHGLVAELRIRGVLDCLGVWELYASRVDCANFAGVFDLLGCFCLLIWFSTAVCVYIHVSVYIHIYIYIHTHTYIHVLCACSSKTEGSRGKVSTH